MARNAIRRRVPAQKSGFWRGVFLTLLGFTGGVGAAAYLAAYINELPVPLSAPPTRDANLPGGESLQRTRRDTLEFHETLRRRRAAPPVAAAPETTVRRFVSYLPLGAFGRRDAAESLRGEVALLGGQASIREDKSENAEIFRVWMGPYPSENDAEESRANLALQGYNEVQVLKLAEENNDQENEE